MLQVQILKIFSIILPAVIAYIIIVTYGGTNTPIEPEAAVKAPAKAVSYPSSFIAGIIIAPIAATVAGEILK